MNKILTIRKAISFAKKIRSLNKTIVVAGGFFDILHTGHLYFLKKAKKYADYLFVLLEEDAKAKEKGENRPINHQKNRAKILSTIKEVDAIVMLKNMTNNDSYDKLMVEIKPNIILTTIGDPNIMHKKRISRLISGKIVYLKKIKDLSTTKYAELIKA